MKIYIKIILLSAFLSGQALADCVVVGNMTNCTGGVRVYNQGSYVEVHTPAQPAQKIYIFNDKHPKVTKDNQKVIVVPVGK
jgi:hypothetical protein